MKKTAALLLLLALPVLAGLHAQDISTHIPKRSTYIVTINPAAHVKNGDVAQLNQLEMFTRTSDYGKGYNFLFGDEDLSDERQAAFSKLFTDVFSAPQATGVDTARKIFIFNDTPDSIHYWAYVLPLSNGNAFGDYVTSHLFSEKPAIDKGSGYSFVSSDRINIGWTNNYAIILLADYDYHFYGNDLFSELIAQHTQDSIAAAEAAQEDYLLHHDSIISDSIRKVRAEELAKEQNEMLEKLAKDTTPEEDVPVTWNTYGSYYYNNANDDNGKGEQQRQDSSVTKMARLQMKALINMLYEESVESVANFRAVSSERSDAVYWYNYGELMQQYYVQSKALRQSYLLYDGMKVDTSQIQNMWANSYIVSVVNFEGNVAKMEQRCYFSPALQMHTRGLYSGRVSKKMFRYVKGENLMGFVAMSVNPEKFMKFYGSVYREALSNSLAGMYANYYLTMWDLARIFIDEKTLYNLFDGKFLFAITDLKPYTASYVTYDYDENFNKTEIKKERTEIRPEFLLVAGLGQKEKAQQILDILERANAVKKQNSLYYLVNTPGEYDVKLFLAIHDGMLIVTNNEDLMQNHLKHGYGKSEGLSSKLKKTGRKSALVGYWDGKRSFELVKKNETQYLSDEDRRSLDVLAENVNSGLIIGKKAKNGVQRIEMQIELNETKEGTKQTSFVRFIRLLNSLFLVRSNTN